MFFNRCGALFRGAIARATAGGIARKEDNLNDRSLGIHPLGLQGTLTYKEAAIATPQQVMPP